MPGPLHDWFFIAHEVEFESDYSLAESVQRLQDLTRAISPAILGTVAEAYVSIYRADPPKRNEFRPWFFGRFLVKNGRVVLRGGYSMHDGMKFFLALWLLVCTIALWLVTIPAIEGTAVMAAPVVPLLLLVAGALVVVLGRRMTRADPAWISDLITRTLKLPH